MPAGRRHTFSETDVKWLQRATVGALLCSLAWALYHQEWFYVAGNVLFLIIARRPWRP